MRMISADDLEQALREAGLAEVIKDDCSKCTSAWGVPIVDAEEVVRCKDCKFINECLLYSSTADKNGYCVLGERREDEID